MTVLITLTAAGLDTGPFDLYSDLDGYTSAFETGVDKATLLSGYPCFTIPDYTNTVRIKSNNGLCTNSIDVPVEAMMTTTTTSTLYPPLDYELTSSITTGCVISIDNITGGSGGYSVGATTFPDYASAENNSSWVVATSINYGSVIGSDIYYTVVKDSDGNILVKGGLPYCEITTTTTSTIAP